MIADTFRIYRKLRNTHETNQPWLKLREEYTWLQQEAKQPPSNLHTSPMEKKPVMMKR
jgi:hypothetical protein